MENSEIKTMLLVFAVIAQFLSCNEIETSKLPENTVIKHISTHKHNIDAFIGGGSRRDKINF